MKATKRSRGMSTRRTDAPKGKSLTRSLPLATLIAATALLSLGTGCGHSIQAVYEGDIRFEHCMAPDARPSVEVRTRQVCWKEWVSHYTYGQTRDRVLHAQLRIQQLNGTGQLSPDANDEPLKAPGPTSALAPPPMFDSARSSFRADDAPRVQTEQCLGQCSAERESCSMACTAGDCRSRCGMGYRTCMRRCN